MKSLESRALQLKTRVVMTFENKTVKKERGLMDTDPTTATLPTTSVVFPFELLGQGSKQQ